MIVVDTTVLVYSKGIDHPLRGPCRELVTAIGEGVIEATTTPEVIQEFAHVRARRLGRRDAARAARDFGELLSPLKTVDHDSLARGLEYFRETERLGSFDAVLAATAVAAGASALVSADTAFGEVVDIPWIVPDAEGVEKLLGRM